MNLENRKSIFEELKELDCCERCILHYIDVTSQEYLKNPAKYFEQFNGSLGGNEAKRVKKNVCRLCLGILLDDSLNKYAEEIKNSKIEEYKDYSTFNLMVSLPKSLFLRQHAINIHLKQKFKEFYKGNHQKFTNILKHSLSSKVSDMLNMRLTGKANLEILLEIGYEDDDKEIEKVADLDEKKCYRKRNTPISRNIIVEMLESVKDENYTKFFPTIPETPSNKAHFISVSINASPIYFGGRYMKFVRNIGQTPWIINEKKITETCVQDIIFEAIEKVLGFKDNLTFSSSGREDADVRMLGNGRPFYIQVDNPKIRNISEPQLRKIEKIIFQSKMIAVLHLQIVYKNDLSRIKEGEEQKRKLYTALCKTAAPNVKEVVEKINSTGSIEIAQKTPLRVIHRRTVAVRKKQIYEMRAKEIPRFPGLFQLDCETQAGTYVKEFVHGDYERTVPNIGTITNYPADIIALDVTKIDLEWPQTN